MLLTWESRGAQNGQALVVSVKLICPRGPRVLVLQQADGSWDLPGGRLESGETIGTALAREVREELGLDLPGNVAPVGEWIYTRPGKPPRHIVFFRMTEEAAFDPAQLALSDEHTGTAWVGLDDLDGLDMPAGFRDAIRTVLSDRG